MSEPTTLVAELWYTAAPDLGDAALLAGLRAVSPDAQAQDGSISVPYVGADGRPAERTPGRNGAGSRPPLLTVVIPGTPAAEGGRGRPDVSQTWDWAEAEEAVADVTASVLVTEMFAEGHAAPDRVAALTSVVAALAAATGPAAVAWPTSQRVSDPALLGGEGLEGVLNVRLFAVADDDEALVMDTLGLQVFGLPDVQCHFRDLDPSVLASVLYSTGSYLFEAGDVIGDGDTISGQTDDERWVCRHEDALIGPARTVVDIDLGDPHAAGRRAR